jgi:hypothetical protein
MQSGKKDVSPLSSEWKNKFISLSSCKFYQLSPIYTASHSRMTETFTLTPMETSVQTPNSFTLIYRVIEKDGRDLKPL